MERKILEKDLIFESKQLTVLNDRVIQQQYEARAINRRHIISNYQSPAKTNYPSLIKFKFSINGKDNEATPGQDHILQVKPINGEYTSPILLFGDCYQEKADPDWDKLLEPNTVFKVRLDMREVLQQFKSKGFYTTYNGEKVLAEDFKGVYIAGGSAPFTWDFDNLETHPQFKLHDDDKDGIYEGTFLLNPHDPTEKPINEWKLQNDISVYPVYKSDQIIVDALYNLSLDETISMIENDNTFRTGKEWEGVWTRDISYSVILSYAFLEPEVSKTSLMRKVKRDRIVQDIGSGGAWPVSTDRVVWALAAWEIYLVTGDEEWLKKVYPIIQNTLEDDLVTVKDKTGLFKGESSFLDWREQTYPDWMDNVDISQSLTLGTNLVYYKTFEVTAEIANVLDDHNGKKKYHEESLQLKDAINTFLWNDEKQYYNQYLYGRYFMNTSPRSETLGEAFSVLFDVADEQRAKKVISCTPVIPFGAPCIYPQIHNVAPYHNNGIWPFVQAFWNMAAKKTKNEKALTHGLACLYRPTALFLTNKENFVAENGDYMGTQINSDSQLWSIAGNLAMVYRVFLGLDFHRDNIKLKPFVPEAYQGTKYVKGFKYRKATIDFEVQGFGDGIDEMSINGSPVKRFEIKGDLKGNHKVIIKMNNQIKSNSTLNLVENKFSLPCPQVKLEDNKISWEHIDDAVIYEIYHNGKLLKEIQNTEYILPESKNGFFTVLAKDKNNVTSFLSKPVELFNEEGVLKLELEKFAEETEKIIFENSRTGGVKITQTKNTNINIPINVPKEGIYLAYFRYSNGSGPWNTDNKCAIRTLKVNGEQAGTVVMAQRGEGEWSNWGLSNPILIRLEKGEHLIQLTYEPWNQNMDGEVNDAIVDYLKLVRI